MSSTRQGFYNREKASSTFLVAISSGVPYNSGRSIAYELSLTESPKIS